MRLMIDIGNTNMVFSLYDEEKLQSIFRVSTDEKKTKAELELLALGMIEKFSLGRRELSDIFISSVVPVMAKKTQEMAGEILGITPKFVSLELNLPFSVNIAGATELGSDFICTASGAVKKYGAPVIVCDLGTGTKFLAINSAKELLGVSILAGAEVSFAALTKGAAQLEMIKIEGEADVIGKTTAEALSSGFLYGSASAVSGMFERFSVQMKEKSPALILTGGLSSLIHPYLENKERVILDENLLTDGMNEIYKMNF